MRSKLRKLSDLIAPLFLIAHLLLITHLFLHPAAGVDMLTQIKFLSIWSTDLKDLLDEVKTHWWPTTKNTQKWIYNPGKPVVSLVYTHTSNIIYVKDTTDINKIKQQHKISKDVLLILIDFRLLYTNIPHNKGLQAVKQSLKKRLSTISTNVHF